MRALAFAIVVLSLAAAGVASSVFRSDADNRLAAARDRVATQGAAATDEVLAALAKTLEKEVGTHAGNSALRNSIAGDAGTLQDLINTEDLKLLRAYPVYAIGRSDSDLPLVTRGLEQVPLDAFQQSPFIQICLRDPSTSPASGRVVVPNGVVIVAAAPTVSSDRTVAGYLAIGQPVVARSLEGLATRAKSTLILTDGASNLGLGGNKALEQGSEALFGHEGMYVDSTHFDPATHIASRVVTLAAGRYLWVRNSYAQDEEAITGALQARLSIVWVLAFVLGLGGGALAWRRGQPVVAPVSPLEQWSGAPIGPTGQTPAQPGQTTGFQGQAPGPGQQVLSVMLPNGQMGQLITGAMPAAGQAVPGVTLNPGGMLPTAPTGQTPPGDPTMFGRYKLLERLGAGGMAEVWIAVVFGAEGFARPFVVKRIRRDMTEHEGLVQQFIDEANLAAQLVHGNVVPVFDFGQLGQEYFLAQEYILGRDLGKVVAALAKAGKRLDPQLSLFVCAEILKALDYAHTVVNKDGHALGIVHRDISPNNILISQRGEVKLIDFGIAKSTTKVNQTELGTVKGNLRFMSPEQARGEPVDPRSDLFSLGASLYYVLRGEPLYGGSNQYDLLVAAAGGPTEAILANVLALPEPINKALARALQPLRDDRFASAQVFLEAIAQKVPVDGARRFAALMQELFGDELKAQERKFAEASRAAQGLPSVPSSDDATVQRLAPGIKQGIP